MAVRYAETTDLAMLGLHPDVLDLIPTEQQELALDYASSRIDDAIGAGVSLPLGVTPVSLKRDCCVIASFEILRVRGFNPEGNDQLIVDEYRATIARLEEIGKREKALEVDRDHPVQPLAMSATVPARVYGSIVDGVDTSGF